MCKGTDIHDNKHLVTQGERYITTFPGSTVFKEKYVIIKSI